MCFQWVHPKMMTKVRLAMYYRQLGVIFISYVIQKYTACFIHRQGYTYFSINRRIIFCDSLDISWHFSLTHIFETLSFPWTFPILLQTLLSLFPPDSSLLQLSVSSSLATFIYDVRVSYWILIWFELLLVELIWNKTAGINACSEVLKLCEPWSE